MADLPPDDADKKAAAKRTRSRTTTPETTLPSSDSVSPIAVEETARVPADAGAAVIEIASSLARRPPAEAEKATGKAPPSASPPRPAKAAKPRDDEEEEDEDDEEEDEDEDDDENELEHATFRASEAAGAFKAFGRFLGPYIAEHRGGFSLVLLGVLIETAFNVAFPLSLKFLIDDVLTEDGDRAQLVWILAVLGILGVLVSITTIWYEWQSAKVGSQVMYSIRDRVFRHTQTLSAGFYSRTKSGSVISRFSGDMATLEDTVMHGVDWGLLPFLELIAGIGLMFFLNWQLAALAMLVFPLTLIGPRFFAPRAVEGTYQLKRRQAEGLAVVSENIGAQLVVKAFSLQKIATRWFHDRNRAIQRQQQRVRFLEALTERSITITVLLLHLVIFGIGATLTYQGQITLGTFVTFESVFWELSYNIGHVTNFIPQLIQGAGAVRHINDILEEPSRAVDRPDAIEIPRLSKEIRFENVSFSYGGQEKQLDGIDFTVPAGSRLAIVGASGSGKSTTLALLLRLYDPISGRITIDGVDIADVQRQSLRNQMAVVFQDNVLFGTTILENLRLGNLDASDEEVVRAARAAEIHSFIQKMPDGYDTVVGERGSTLSGGQRQRLAIARAIVRNPAILLLDEATSALDHTTEAAINKTLRRVGKGRTTITVTHRIASITDYDNIVVMEAGRIVQQGTHEELIKRRGVYQRLWNQQKYAREEEAAE